MASRKVKTENPVQDVYEYPTIRLFSLKKSKEEVRRLADELLKWAQDKSNPPKLSFFQDKHFISEHQWENWVQDVPEFGQAELEAKRILSNRLREKLFVKDEVFQFRLLADRYDNELQRDKKYLQYQKEKATAQKCNHDNDAKTGTIIVKGCFACGDDSASSS